MPHSSVGTPAFAVGSQNEVSFSSLTPDEQEQFVISDKAEWEAIKSTNAVRVLSLEESMKVRQTLHDRIMASRIVRRWKPIPRLNKSKA